MTLVYVLTSLGGSPDQGGPGVVSGYLAQQPPPQQQVAGPVQTLQQAQQAALG